MRLVYLAEDDDDDRSMFEEVVRDISDVELTTANNGSQLMSVLKTKTPPPPYLIFLDLNMPLKNGEECLREIRANGDYKHFRVAIFSTSCQKNVIDEMYDKDADYYICKPNSFSKYRSVIKKIMEDNMSPDYKRPSRKDFLIEA